MVVTKIRQLKDIDREGIFKNFRVNEFSFNFFLKDLQFDKDFIEVKSRSVRQSDQTGTLEGITIIGKSKSKK